MDFRNKISQILKEFFGILRNCSLDDLQVEYLIYQDPKVRISYKMGDSISLQLYNLYDPNTGSVIIESKAIIDSKGPRFETLFNYYPFGSSLQAESSGKYLQSKINIIENGSITFRLEPRAIILKLTISNKYRANFDAVITVKFLDHNNDLYIGERVFQTSPSYAMNPQGFNPGFMPHGNMMPRFGFGGPFI